MNLSAGTSRKILRKALREKRRQLSAAEQLAASKKLLQQLRQHPAFLRSKRIALYMARDGEINPQYVLKAAEAMGKKCFLPIVHPLNTGQLLFGPYSSGDALMLNHFGIAEPPVNQKIIAPWAIDLILMPLVGFDRNGNRLGMGGGFYDRTFEFIKNNTRPKSPTLIGLAHSCQEVDSLSNENWDIPVEWIATDKEIISAN